MAPLKDLPYEMENVSSQEDKVIKKCLQGYTRPFIKCGPGRYVMPGKFKKHAEAIYNMEVRPDDVWVVTYPRSGTTWTQELIWLVENNLDFETAKAKPLYERFPMLETSSHIPEMGVELIKANFMNLGSFQGLHAAVRTPSWELIDKMPSPRFIKTHLPLSMLPQKLLSTARVIYVARDPRDVAVSYYYLHKLAAKHFLRAKLKDFWNAFRMDLLPCSPIVTHANEAWLKRDNPNLLFIFYEDLIKNLPHQIGRVCMFLNRKYSDEQISQLAGHISFDSLRKNKKVNNTTTEKKAGVQFVRKGEVGGWITHFDKTMEAQSEEFLLQRLRNVDVIYPSINVEIKECSYL